MTAGEHYHLRKMTSPHTHPSYPLALAQLRRETVMCLLLHRNTNHDMNRYYNLFQTVRSLHISNAIGRTYQLHSSYVTYYYLYVYAFVVVVVAFAHVTNICIELHTHIIGQLLVSNRACVVWSLCPGPFQLVSVQLVGRLATACLIRFQVFACSRGKPAINAPCLFLSVIAEPPARRPRSPRRHVHDLHEMYEYQLAVVGVGSPGVY